MILQIERMKTYGRKETCLITFGSSDTYVRYRPKHPRTDDNKIRCRDWSEACTVLHTCELVFQCEFRHVNTRKICSDVHLITYESTKPLLKEKTASWAIDNGDRIGSLKGKLVGMGF